ncbi:MAG TPA: biopolymer transporter ExbB [Rhodospirillaceae bacterium]|jgi:chemotaxis protein MotA|nr:MotA/TolQ/ExbB proton channel family protein [Alphaproteobacteria bacterium]HBH26394.1 biopolymer transporter ExbB [Rhodospirillaceae bacterium]
MAQAEPSLGPDIPDRSQQGGREPQVNLPGEHLAADWATLGGLLCAMGLIVAAIGMGAGGASFFNLPALLIVLLGTAAATAVSYTGREISGAWRVIARSIFSRIRRADFLARALMDLAIIARKKGLLALIAHERDLKREPFLARAVQLVVDGYPPKDIEEILGQETYAMAQRHRRAASITRRASEIAPAMGLIGTLVGLVQMLANLTDPDAIGPAMAVALLTTFYGAILGTVVMGPLAIKLEKRSDDEVLLRTLVTTAALSIARQENPRRLEMLLNAILPPAERIRYFD